MTAAAPLSLMPANVSQALSVYQSVDRGSPGPAPPPADTGAPADFGSLLTKALEGVIATGKQADTQAMHAIAGNADITSVVTAVSRAQLALQTTVAIRDRVLQAYQDVIKMPI